MSRLNRILRVNSSTCFTSGLIFTFFSKSSASFFFNSSEHHQLILITGLALTVNGLHLFLSSFRKSPFAIEIIYFCLGDFLWVAGSVLLLGYGLITQVIPAIAFSMITLAILSLLILQLKELQKLMNTDVG